MSAPAAATTTWAADLPMPITAFAAVFSCPPTPTAAPLPASADALPPPSTPARTTLRPAVPSTPFATSTMGGGGGCGSFVPPPGSPSGNALASSSSAGTSGRWYSVTYGRQIGVFRDWYGVVEPLVNGVPGWKCKSFSTLAAATTHFNACAAAGVTGVHID